MFHNLLPQEKKKALKREYILRACVVGFVLCSFAAILGTTTLVPTYTLLLTEDHTLNSNIETLSRETSKAQEAASTLKEVTRSLELLRSVAMATRTTALINDVVLSTRPEGVMVTFISVHNAKHTVTVEGVAKERSSLVRFVRNLERNDSVGRVTNPVSNLAKKNNLTFTLTVTLAQNEHKKE